MHSAEEVRAVLSLAERGLSASKIAREAGLPRRTVGDWLAGRHPQSFRRRSGCERCGATAHDPATLDRHAYAYLFGMYPGDGCLSRHARGVYRLRVTLDAIHPRIAAECQAAMKRVVPASRASIWRHPRDRLVVVSSYSRGWPCLFPQHGPGPKHRRKIALSSWQSAIVDERPEPFMRGLIHSDGCRVVNRVSGKGYLRYMFSNRSRDIRELFCSACDLIGVRWTQSNDWTISIARRGDVKRLDKFVGAKG